MVIKGNTLRTGDSSGNGCHGQQGKKYANFLPAKDNVVRLDANFGSNKVLWANDAGIAASEGTA